MPRYAEPPITWVGSDLEWLVYQWLMKNVGEGNFTYQASIGGGRLQLGGLVADFIIYTTNPPIAINVQGSWWHRETSKDRANDLLAKIQLSNEGYTVVFLAEDDVVNRLNYVMRQALMGIQLYPD